MKSKTRPKVSIANSTMQLDPFTLLIPNLPQKHSCLPPCEKFSNLATFHHSNCPVDDKALKDMYYSGPAWNICGNIQ